MDTLPAGVTIDGLFDVLDSLQPKHTVVPEIHDPEQCRNCKKFDGILGPTCTFCGFTEQIYICEEAEWKSGVSEDGVAHDPCRVGMAADPLYSSNWGRATLISTNFKNRQKYGLAARINFHSSMNHRDRALHKAYQEFDAIAQTLGIGGSIVQYAKTYYKKFSETALTRGAVRNGIKANCLFWACKINKFPRSTQEIADAFGISTNDISRTFDKTREIINPKINSITKPVDMVPRIFNTLGINVHRENARLKMKCCRVCESVARCPKLMGKTPNAVAVVVIYRVLKDTPSEISKEMLADKISISIATINKLDVIVKGIISK